MLKFLAAGTHLGGTNLDFQMEQYVYKRKSDGECLKPVPSCMMSGHKVIVQSVILKWLHSSLICRCVHHQPEEDLGEAAAGCQGYCCH